MSEFPDDFEVDFETSCPHCGHHKIHYRHCGNCEDGYVDLYEDDPLWYDPNEEGICPDCNGKEVIQWCPNCGADVNTVDIDEILE